MRLSAVFGAREHGISRGFVKFGNRIEEFRGDEEVFEQIRSRSKEVKDRSKGLKGQNPNERRPRD